MLVVQEVTEYPTWEKVRLKLEEVLKMLDKYEIDKYTDWSNRVSEILGTIKHILSELLSVFINMLDS